MSEKKPSYKGQVKPEDIRDYFKRHPVQRKIINTAMRPLLFMMDPAFRNPNALTGMLKDAIISERLLYPSPESDGVSYQHALAGRWLAYDFHRPEILGSKKGTMPQLFKGKLRVHMLEELHGRPGNQESPTFNILDVVHGLDMSYPSIQKLIDEEFVAPTTHQGAYRQVGVYDKYAEAIHSRGVADDFVYQVTSKGNALIFLDSDHGTRKPREDTEKSMVFGRLPGVAHHAAALMVPTQIMLDPSIL